MRLELWKQLQPGPAKLKLARFRLNLLESLESELVGVLVCLVHEFAGVFKHKCKIDSSAGLAYLCYVAFEFGRLPCATSVPAPERVGDSVGRHWNNRSVDITERLN